MSLADLERFSKASPVVASLLAEGRTDSLTAAVRIAAACGYHFTVEEAQAFLSRRPATAARHLTDEQLEKVTGGLGWARRLLSSPRVLAYLQVPLQEVVSAE